MPSASGRLLGRDDAGRLLEVQPDAVPPASGEGGVAARDPVPHQRVELGDAEPRPHGLGGAREGVANGRQHRRLLLRRRLERLGVARVTPVGAHAGRDVGQYEIARPDGSVRSVRDAVRRRPERGLEDARDRPPGLPVDECAQVGVEPALGPALPGYLRHRRLARIAHRDGAADQGQLRLRLPHAQRHHDLAGVVPGHLPHGLRQQRLDVRGQAGRLEPDDARAVQGPLERLDQTHPRRERLEARERLELLDRERADVVHRRSAEGDVRLAGAQDRVPPGENDEGCSGACAEGVRTKLRDSRIGDEVTEVAWRGHDQRVEPPRPRLLRACSPAIRELVRRDPVDLTLEALR